MRSAFALRIFSGKNIYNFAILENLRSLSGQSPSICLRRPLCHLKAPLGLSLLRKRGFSGIAFSRGGIQGEKSPGGRVLSGEERTDDSLLI